jgi:hypothetical protein
MAIRKKASKKKAKKKSAASKSSVAKKVTPAKKQTPKKSVTKKVAKKKKAAVRAAAKKKTGSKQSAGPVSAKAVRKQPRKGSRNRDSGSAAFRREPARSRGGEEAGDLQGLSNVESVDSESVDELLEEGNAFEAGIVAGVEDSGQREGQEVRTREVPEDDVPEEYLDPE